MRVGGMNSGPIWQVPGPALGGGGQACAGRLGLLRWHDLDKFFEPELLAKGGHPRFLAELIID